MSTKSLNPAAVEMAGRNWLAVELMKREIQVAIPIVDRGVDIIAFREVQIAGIRAMPLQLKCSTNEAFSLDRKYAGRGVPLVYIWNVFTQPSCLMLDYDEALEVLTEKTKSTASWLENGYYAFNSIGSDLRARLMPYFERWDWLERRLANEPVSD